MLKTLLKKQLLEFFSGFFMNTKNGRAHSNASKAGFIALFGFMLIAFFAMFFSVAFMLTPLIADGFSWIYFSVLGILATFMGVFGSVFMTYNTLYEAKDNDLLLSMPIPTGLILFSRMAGLYLSALFFEGLVMIPAGVAYCMTADFNAAALLFVVLNVFILPLPAISISCVLGWIIALFASKIRNKGFITVIVSIAFFGVYYFFSMRLNTIITAIITNAEMIGEKIKLYIYPLYAMGKGCSGDVLSYLVFVLIAAAVFAVIYGILSRSFIKLVTTKKGLKKKEYKEKEAKSKSVRAALLKKELLYLKSTPVYMLNCALGSVLLVVCAVFIAVKGNDFLLVFSMLPFPEEGYAVVVGIILCFVASTNNITSPSISLEAKNLWFLKSVPVKTDDIFFAKIMLHLTVTGVPLIICCISASVFLFGSVLTAVLLILFTVPFVAVCAGLGLLANLIFPKMEWVNEAVPVKQSLSAMIGMFSGMLLTMLVIAVYFFTAGVLSSWVFLCGSGILFTAAAALIYRILCTVGKNKFSEL